MILQTLLYGVLLLMGCLAVGHGVLWGVRQPKGYDGFYALFIRAVVGFLAVTAVYAAVITSGNTVLWGVILVGVLWLAVRRRWITQTLHAEPVAEPSPGPLAVPLLILLVILAGFLLLHGLLQFHTPLHNIQHFDEVYYAWLTSKMELFGVESDDPLFAGPHSFPAMPYHYADLWLAALVAKLASVSNLIAYAVIVKSLFHALSVFGFLTLARTYTRNRAMLLFSLSAVIVAPVLLDYSHIVQNACNLGQVKGSIASLFFIWTLYLHRKESTFWFFPLLVLPVINIAFAPVVLPSMLALAAYIYIRRKDRKKTAIMAGGSLAVGAFIFAFYALQPKLVKDPFSLYDDLLVFIDLRYLADMTYQFAVNYAMFVPYLLPLLLFVAWKLHRKESDRLTALLHRHETIIAYTAFSMVTGWAMAFLFWPLAGENASQMNTNSNFMLVPLLVVVALLAVYEQLEPTWHRMLLTLFMGVIFTYSIGVYAKSRQHFLFNPASQRSTEYIMQVTRHFDQSGADVLGGTVKCPDEFHQQGKAGSRSELMNGYWFTPFVSSMDFLYVTSLNTLTSTYEDFDHSTLDFALERDRKYYWWVKKTEKSLRRAAFTHFHMAYIQQHPQATEVDVQLAFAQAHGLGYLVTSGQCPLPEAFIPMVDTMFVDGMSGERFYFLQQPNN